MHTPTINTPQVQSPLLNGKDAAAYLTIGRSHFHALLRANRITAIRIGGAVRFRIADLDRLIAESAQTA